MLVGVVQVKVARKLGSLRLAPDWLQSLGQRFGYQYLEPGNRRDFSMNTKN